MGRSAHRIRGLASLVLPAVLFSWVGVALARQAATVKTVRYHGYVVRIPRSWRVYDLSKDPQVCVRFDRHALYLGIPSSRERCPAHAVGRTEAILIEPFVAAAARLAGGSGSAAARLSLDGFGTRFVVRPAGVAVTATWASDPGLVAHALSRAPLPASSTAYASSPRRARTAGLRAHIATAVFTGLGFDACGAPSLRAMSAWALSPYRAIGVYVGGVNAACAQTNLTAGWVSSQVAAGWHLIPTYVGLQAPHNSCGCAPINPAQASAEGTAAADDALSSAQALGIPAGNPIYYDMESYPPGGTNTSTVLAFLSAWTSQLHAAGYASGVYSSASTGITDLAKAVGTSFVVPDDIWIAEWNGEHTTNSSYVPSSDWSNQQRLHQYQGGHDATYGGVTLSIDSDYLAGATADTTSGAVSAPPPPPPTLVVSPQSDGTTNLSVKWNANTGSAFWRVLAGPSPDPGSLTAVATAPAHGSTAQIAVHSGAAYFAVQALGSSGQLLATSAPVATPAHISIYGRSVFARLSSGVAGLPVGCFTSHPCRLSTTVAHGRSIIARTGPEHIGQNRNGILYVRLTSRGRMMLAVRRRRKLKVKVKVSDPSGTAASVTLSLIPFDTSGGGPGRSLTQSPTLRIVGVSDFVSPRGVGGILAGCRSSTPCRVTTVLSHGRMIIARTGPEFLGANELGYLIFSLTPRGRAMLGHAPGNQLGAHLAITNGAATATAHIALVQFS